MLIHAASLCRIARAPGQYIHLPDCAWHGMHVGPYTELAFPYADSYFDNGMCAALAGSGDRFQRPVPAPTSRSRRLWARGEALPPLAPLQCTQTRAFAHPCAARMLALRSHAFHALPSCVVAVLMLSCVCRVQAYDVVQAHVQSGALGVWDAAREGWAGQGRC